MSAEFSSDVNKDWTPKDQDEDKDQTLKDKDKDKDHGQTFKDKDKDWPHQHLQGQEYFKL